MGNCVRAAMVLGLVCGVGASAGAADATLRLAGIFGDGMVLQRDREIPVWGWGDPGQAVRVRLGESDASATAGADGKWLVRLPARKAGGPLELTVESAGQAITLKDVLIGDVWLCSGQSNMEFGLGGALGSDQDIREANFPQIRFRKIYDRFNAMPQPDVARGQWRPAVGNSARSFCAIGFYFARDVHQATGVPIGLIDTSASSSSIGPWWTPASLDAEPELSDLAKMIRERTDAYRKALPAAVDAREAWVAAMRKALAAHADELKPPAGARVTATLDAQDAWVREARAGLAGDGNTPSAPPLPHDFATIAAPLGDANALKAPPVSPNGPGEFFSAFALYNGRIHPLMPTPIKGVLWYQGEANGMEGHSYFIKMRALIAGWRKLWGQPDLPFYYVQLASWQKPNENPAGGDGWARVRAAQAEALSIPHTGMAVSIDVGDAVNIHPPAKYDVGHRLALWALAKDYGKKDLVYSGPIYRGMKVEGDKVRLSFDHVGGGLMIGKKEGRSPVVEDTGGKLARFAVAGEDKVWHWAEAKIDGDTVLVWSDKVAKPVAVRYAYSWNPAGANLYNRAGLPTVPFRTDDW